MTTFSWDALFSMFLLSVFSSLLDSCETGVFVVYWHGGFKDVLPGFSRTSCGKRSLLCWHTFLSFSQVKVSQSVRFCFCLAYTIHSSLLFERKLPPFIAFVPSTTIRKFSNPQMRNYYHHPSASTLVQLCQR